MGLGQTSGLMYLSIGFGRIRRTANEGTEGAVERALKSGKKTYAIEYNYVSGTLVDIKFKDDTEYGKSWTLIIKDGDKDYGVQISEESRYASDLLKCMPNLHKNQYYKFTPYDFENNGKRKKGLSIKNEHAERVENYYQDFNQVDGKWDIKNKYGFPVYEGDSKDTDELKIYFMRATKFLREKALEHVATHFGDGNNDPLLNQDNSEPGKDQPEDDLPF